MTPPSNRLPRNAAFRRRSVPGLLLLLTLAGPPAGAQVAPAIPPNMMDEFRSRVLQINLLERKHQELGGQIDRNHAYIEYLFHMNEPPPGHLIVMVEDFPILLSSDQVAKLAHSYALRELLADRPTKEAEKWRKVLQNREMPAPPPVDTVEFWMQVLEHRHIQSRGKLKDIFRTVMDRDQIDRENLHHVTDQYIATQQNLQKFLAAAVPPPSAPEADLPPHEREFHQYMRQTQAILDANCQRFIQNQMGGRSKPPSAPGRPTGMGPGDEPVNPTIGRELEEQFRKMDAIVAEIFR